VALLAYVRCSLPWSPSCSSARRAWGGRCWRKCFALVALFGYAAFYTIAYGTVIWCWCLIGDPIVMALRVVIALALTWAIVELLRGNIRRGERWP
jgi:hypothetical protein